MKIGEIYLVEWEDAASTGSWTRISEEFDKTVCETVGWLLRQDEHHILLANSRNDAEQDGGLWYIPKSLVRKSRKLI